MQLVSHPRLAEPPREPDVAIVGAGAAGIAAARKCLAAGISVAVLEARERVGGRAMTVLMRGHPVDLGAHWLHSGRINPLVKLARERGETLRQAPLGRDLFVGRREGTRAEKGAIAQGFEIAERNLSLAAKEPQDRDVESALAVFGPWRWRIAGVHRLLAGRALAEVSVKDTMNTDYAGNHFIRGGLGAYLARLAHGLPVRLRTRVTAIDWSGNGIAIETDAGTVRARTVIVTIPPVVVQRGAVRITPALPDATREALESFTSGVYEHVVLHWPSAPFRSPDRLVTLAGTRRRGPGLFTRIDGTPFHYLALDRRTALAHSDPAQAARFARAVLADQFGHRVIAGLSVPAVTAWRNDRLSEGSWSVVPPGHCGIREAIKAGVAERMWFAGEFASRKQWGTVGGAWQEGERAAEEAISRLRAGS